MAQPTVGNVYVWRRRAYHCRRGLYQSRRETDSLRFAWGTNSICNAHPDLRHRMDEITKVSIEYREDSMISFSALGTQVWLKAPTLN